MKQDDELAHLMKMDFQHVLSEYVLFVENIPVLARLMGRENFVKKMGFTDPQYYRRTKNIDLWKTDEVKRAIEIFKSYNIGK